MVTEVHILDIDTELKYIDKILEKYLPLPEGLIFLKGVRDPISSRNTIKKYIKKGLISDKPYHPYLSAYLMKDIAELILIDTVEYDVKELFYKTLVNNTDHIYNIRIGETITDLIYDMTNNEATVEDVKLIEGYVNVVQKKLETIIGNDINHVYEVDIHSGYFVIRKLINICEYRYKQTLKEKMYD